MLALGFTAGCALKGDVRRVELQVEALRVERARADSHHVAAVDSVRALLAAIQERLVAQQAYLVQLRGDVKTDLLAVQQQLVSVQELTGQSQQRLTELKNDFIGNMTHELKTPIATVSVAVEALRHFNALQDPVRTQEYLEISAGELQRLSLMVDKVLKLSLFETKGIELKNES